MSFLFVFVYGLKWIFRCVLFGLFDTCPCVCSVVCDSGMFKVNENCVKMPSLCLFRHAASAVVAVVGMMCVLLRWEMRHVAHISSKVQCILYATYACTHSLIRYAHI